MTERAAEYAVLLAYGETWVELACYENREKAIQVARRHLRLGVSAASVQGRGAVNRPTPPSEITVYRGVAETFSADAFFGGATGRAPAGVEVVNRAGNTRLYRISERQG